MSAKDRKKTSVCCLASILVFEEVLSLGNVETCRSLVNWLVLFSVKNVESCCQKASDSRAKSVGVQVMVNVILMISLPNRVSCRCDADRWVEGGTQFGSACNHAH